MEGHFSKSITFSNKDKGLVERIEQYRKEHKIDSFIGAVRKLCDDALQFKQCTKN